MNNYSFPGNPIYYGNTKLPNQDTEQFTEQSYIENILRLNRGKKVRIHMTFPDSNEFRDKVFTGVIEQSGRDHIILSDSTTGNWYLLLIIYLDYIEFNEKINTSGEFYPQSNWITSKKMI